MPQKLKSPQVDIFIPPAFEDIFTPSRYKVYKGGRGSGKSQTLATALIVKGAQKKTRILCAREFQNSIKDSVKKLLEDLIEKYQLKSFYEITETEIRGKNGTLFLFYGLKNNIDSIKSMEAIDICWVEEAQTVSQRSLDVLIPTIRNEGSEIWFSYNPTSEFDAVDVMFKNPPPNSIVKNVNYDQNPFFPEVLRQEMQHDKKNDPEKYNHVWLGGYRTTTKGAYYTKQLNRLIELGRITTVSHRSELPVYTAWDLGWNDFTSIWFYQKVGSEIYVIDYLESRLEDIAYYATELRKKNYNYSPLILPHDAYHKSLGTGKSIAEILSSYGFSLAYPTLEDVPKVSVVNGIEAVRSTLPRCWFDKDKCKIGLEHLQNYTEVYDRNSGITKEKHDEHSHGSDAFRYLSVASDFHYSMPDVQSHLSPFDDDYGMKFNFKKDELGIMRIT